MENLSLLNVLAGMIEFMATFYLDDQSNRSKEIRTFNAVSENTFVENKLNPLSIKVIRIFDIYMSNHRGVNYR
jgi:hypothetical protein